MTWHTTTELDSTHFTSSQEQGAVFSLTSYLDTIQSEQQRSKNIRETSCSHDKQTDTCRSSPSGTTWQPSTGIPGEDQLTFFAEDSPAKTSVQRVKEQELQENVRDYGKNMRDSLEKCGLSLSLPKTHHCFELGGLELSSKIWPRWGIMLDGECSELGTSVRRINVTECGSWHTPTVVQVSPRSSESWKKMKEKRVASGRKTLPPGTLQEQVMISGTNPCWDWNKSPKNPQNWPTPCTRDYKGANAPSGLIRKDGKSRIDQLPNAVAYSGTQIQQKCGTPRCFMYKDALTDRGRGNLGEQVNEAHKMKKMGKLNPSWVAWLMGWPVGWTDLKPLETDKYLHVQPWHSIFSARG